MKKSIPLFLAFATIVSFAFVKPNSKAPKQINVVIDAGHGGSDFGATSSSSTEKQIVEQITNKIKFLNKNENVSVHVTRIGDEFLSLSDRSVIINKIKPDLVLSLHVNKSSNVAKSGMEFYIANESIANEKSNKIHPAFSLNAQREQNQFASWYNRTCNNYREALILCDMQPKISQTLPSTYITTS